MRGSFEQKRILIASAALATAATLGLGAFFLTRSDAPAASGLSARGLGPANGADSPDAHAIEGGVAPGGGTSSSDQPAAYTIAPRHAQDGSASAAAEGGGGDGGNATATAQKLPPRKKLSELTPEERRRYVEGRVRRSNFRRSRIATAKAVARDERACGSGDERACARLTDQTASGNRIAVLAEVKSELSGACDGKDLNACIHRGDLELVGKDRPAAAGWYEKAKVIAGDLKASCDAGAEKSQRKCSRAKRTLDQITRREQRLTANDAGAAGAPKPDGGKLKQPRVPRPPIGTLMRKGKSAPQPSPLAPLEKPAVPAAATTPAQPTEAAPNEN